MCAPAHGGRASYPGDRAPVLVRRDGPSLPEAPRQCRGAADYQHCAPPPLSRPARAQRASGLPPARRVRAAAAIVTASHPVGDLRYWRLHVPPDVMAPASADGRPPSSRWTLALAAEVRCAQGLAPRLVSDEPIRLALRRLGVAWKRAKHGMSRPDPAYTQTQNGATG